MGELGHSTLFENHPTPWMHNQGHATFFISIGIDISIVCSLHFHTSDQRNTLAHLAISHVYLIPGIRTIRCTFTCSMGKWCGHQTGTTL